MFRQRPVNWVGIAFLFALTALIGCGGGSGPKLPKVKGTVTYQGSKVANATVTFRAKDGSAGGSGRTNADGVFVIVSGLNQEGLPPGEYSITVTKVEFSGGSVSEDDPNYDPNAPASVPKSLLPKKYGEIATTDLSFTVVEGNNDVPLLLVD